MGKIIPGVKDILKYIEDNDIKFVRLAFSDVYGAHKNVSVLSGALASALSDGVDIEADAVIPGAQGELMLFPDRATLATLPWRPAHGRVCRLWCDLTDTDGAVSPMCTRALLRDAEECARNAGVNIGFAAEVDFYLFRLDENGEPTEIPMDGAGYLDVAPADKGENVRRAICLSMEELGIYPQKSMHRRGPGQNEITFRATTPFCAADNLLALKNAIGAVAATNGLHADFRRCALPGKPENNFRITITAARPSGTVKDAFALTDSFAQRIGQAMPVISAYFGEGGADGTWSVTVKNASGVPKIVVEAPKCECNPYIVYALLLRAGLAGDENIEDVLPDCIRAAFGRS